MIYRFRIGDDQLLLNGVDERGSLGRSLDNVVMIKLVDIGGFEVRGEKIGIFQVRKLLLYFTQGMIIHGRQSVTIIQIVCLSIIVFQSGPPASYLAISLITGNGDIFIAHIMVDDNHFGGTNRKYQSLMFGIISPNQKVVKTFVFESLETHQSVIEDIQVDFGSEFINLNHIFNKYSPLKTHRIIIYHPTSNSFLPLNKIGSECGIFHKDLLDPSVILIRYRMKLPFPELEADDQRDMRSKERTVREAIDLVKKWRNLHSHYKPGSLKKKINLQEAARMLGVSKKSLDDYYCQLRLAQMYGFDFEKNLEEKMGVLRLFVKDKKVEEENLKLKPHRHPKHLKVIQSFGIGMQEKEEKTEGTEGKGKQVQIDNLENEFFRGFQFLLDDPADPFLTLNKDCSNKVFEEESDGIMFF